MEYSIEGKSRVRGFSGSQMGAFSRENSIITSLRERGSSNGPMGRFTTETGF